jgi:formylglycine-generating enzyme required for sulfatase activity
MENHTWIVGFVLVIGVTAPGVLLSQKQENVAPRVITNSLGMKFALIPKGKFMMGSPPSEKERKMDEVLREENISRDFYMGVHEVTQEQYEKLMGENPSGFKGPNLPVETVSWDDAVSFCRKLSELREEAKAGRKYRLPSEAEWEYACRAGTVTPFHFGGELNGTRANCEGKYPYGTNVKGPYLGKTNLVGSYPANPWGLHDMHGNVWEWCADLYGKNPADPQASRLGGDRLLKGGSWNSSAKDCRAARRLRLTPVNKSNNRGFRVLLDSAK